MNGASSEQKVTVAASTAAAVIFVVALMYVFSGQLGEDLIRATIGLGDVLAAGVCTGLCYILWRSFGRAELLKQVWFDLGVGLALWTLAELIYGMYELILQQEAPNPSLADAVWLPGFIPIFFAFWLRYRSLRVRLSGSQLATVVISFALLASLSLTFVVMPNLRNATSGHLGALALGVLYGVGDLLLAMAVGLTIVTLLGGQLTRSWMLVAVGFLSIAVGDSLYYTGIPTGWYSTDMPVNLFSAVADITYFAGYIIIALGLYDQAVLQRAV